MSEHEQESSGLTDAAKASVLNAGVIGQLKQALHGHEPEQESDLHALRQDAKAMAESLQSLLNGGRLDDTTALKISGALSRLKAVLQGGGISREALSAVLSEAASLAATAEGSASQGSATTIEKLWQQVETYNHEINDDFEKMRKAGVLFDEKLWNKHKQLLDQLRLHPHDITNQKELDAVDDALLHQAEQQLDHCPGAKHAFDDAKKKSDERHKVVDHDLQEKANRTPLTTAELDWDAPISKSKSVANDKSACADVTINDVTLQNIGQKSKPSNKTLS